MRVLFVGFPGEGHLRPLLPLARAAVDAGHDLRFATGPDGMALVASAGLPVMEAGTSMAEWRRQSAEVVGPPDKPTQSGVMAAGRDGWKRASAAFATVYAPKMADDILASLGSWVPDLVVHDTVALAGGVVARLLHAACAAHGYGVLRPPESWASFDEAARPLWERFGLGAPEWVGLRDSAYVDPVPPGLQSRSAVSVGRLLRIRTVEASPRIPTQRSASASSSSAAVYVTFGTLYGEPELLRATVLGAASVAAEVIVTVGRRMDPKEVGALPRNVHVHQFVAQEEILGRVSAVVCHAGSGSLLGALAAGLPVVMIPQGADQFWNADACVEAGAGLSLDVDSVCPETVSAAVRTVLEEERFGERAGGLAAEIEQMPSPAQCLARLMGD
jgi:UDP:flavonoid glycosyltransferase YjiC (YdhE family)